MRLSLAFLGPFQAALDGQPIHQLLSPRIQGLLAYLALEATQPHPRDLLAARFWPDEPEHAARQNLRQALYQLRQSLDAQNQAAAAPKPFLIVTRAAVQFNTASDYTLDVEAFRTFVQTRQYAEAVALYQADLLDGLPTDSAALEEWLVVQREQLHMQVLHALDQLTQAAIDRTDFAAAQSYARRQLALEPWREAAHRQLLYTLAAAGDRNAALTHFETCRRVLAAELGVEPDAETRALVERIRAGQLTRTTVEPELAPAPRPTSEAAIYDLLEAPDVPLFHGRQDELSELQHWLRADQCRLVTILGMGGMGKTALAATLARQAATEFACVVWRSLVNAPPLSDVLRDWIYMLSGRQIFAMPDGLDAQLALLFTQLRARRCLLILDNVETLMQSGDRAGYFRPGFADYGQLFTRIGASQHASCLVLTSREQPFEVARLERSTPVVHSLRLTGLAPGAGAAILRTQGVTSAAATTRQLVDRYSGNPLALMLIAETIQEIYAGDVDAFLGAEAPIFDDIRDVLDQQFARLSPLEQELLCWLALEREPVSAEQLADDLLQAVPQRTLLETLNSLRRRSLIERTGGEVGDSAAGQGGSQGYGFMLQNVVLEYVAGYVVDQIAQEVVQAQPFLLARHALIKAEAKTYVRQSQIRTILQPIAERLIATLGNVGLIRQCNALLQALHVEHTRTYTTGNLLNLLLHLHVDLRGYDFSGLTLRQAYLRGAELPQVNFSHAAFEGSTFTDYAGAVTCVALSPDGNLLAAGADNGTIYLWQGPRWELVGLLRGHTAHVWSIAFDVTTAGQRLATGSGDLTVRIWELPTRRCLQVLTGHRAAVTTVRFHPFEPVLASASLDYSVRLWDADRGQVLSILTEPGSGIESCDFSPDGELLATGGHERLVRLWDWRRGEVVRTLSGHTDIVYVVRFSPCPHPAASAAGPVLVSGSFDATLWLWDAATGNCIARMTGHTAPISAAIFSADGEWLVSGSDDQTARVWDVRNPEQPQFLQLLQGHLGTVRSIAVGAPAAMGQRLVVTGSYDKTVRLWEGVSGRAQAVLRGHSKSLRALAFTPEGRLLAAGNDGHTVRVWDGDTGGALLGLREHASLAENLTLSPDGRQLASAGWDQTACIWDLRNGKLKHVLRGHAGAVAAAVVGADASGRQVVATGGLDRQVRVWDAERGTLLACWSGHEDRVAAFAFAAQQSLLVSGSWDRTLGLWDLGRGALIHFLHGHAEPIVSVAIDPRAERMASGGWYGSLWLWDVRTGERLAALEGHTDGLEMVTFNPSGTLLASCACDHLVLVWDVQHQIPAHHGAATLRPLYRLQGHTSWVRCVAFAHTGRLLASGSDDGTVRIWDVTPEGAGRCVQTIQMEDPYTGMDISGATGITPAQRATLKALGAIDR